MAKISDLKRKMYGIQTSYSADTGKSLHEAAALEMALAEGDITEDQKARDAKEKSRLAKTKAASQQSNVESIIGGVTTTAKAAGKAAQKGREAKELESGGELTPRQQKRADRKTLRQDARHEKRVGRAPKMKGFMAPILSGGKVSAEGEWTSKGIQAQAAAGELAVEKKGWGSDKPPSVTITENPLYKVGTPGKGAASAPQGNRTIKGDGGWSYEVMPNKDIRITEAPEGHKSGTLLKSGSKGPWTAIANKFGIDETPEVSEPGKPPPVASKPAGVFASDVGESTTAYARIYRMNEADRSAALAKLTPSQQQRYAALVSDYEKRKGITPPKPIAPKTPKKGIVSGFQRLFGEGIEMGEDTP